MAFYPPGALNIFKPAEKLHIYAAALTAYQLSRGQLLVAILFHYTVTWAGSLGEHLFWLMGIQMDDGTLSERRQALPFIVFDELLRRLLCPLNWASAQAFYRGWRLVAIDGVGFSLPNTEQVNQKCRKGGNQKGRAAFAKLQCAVLLELLMHNPLAARLGWSGESEWKLAQGLLEQLPPNCLLLADRLYGCGAFVIKAWQRLKELNGHFLVRVKLGLSIVQEIRRLEDGSRIVETKRLFRGRTVVSACFACFAVIMSRRGLAGEWRQGNRQLLPDQRLDADGYMTGPCGIILDRAKGASTHQPRANALGTRPAPHSQALKGRDTFNPTRNVRRRRRGSVPETGDIPPGRSASDGVEPGPECRPSPPSPGIRRSKRRRIPIAS